MGSERQDIEEKRREIQARAARAKTPQERIEIMQREDEPLRLALCNIAVQTDPFHAQQRAKAREDLERFQRTGSTFQKSR